MTRHPDKSGNLAVALDLKKKGYIPVAILPGTKIPIREEKEWQQWAVREVTEESIYERWEGTRNGVAVLCKDLVVMDVDEENELDFVVESCGLQGAPICRTPRGGFHVHGRRRKGLTLSKVLKVKGREIDLLTGSALSIVPESVGENGVRYSWLGEGLPPMSELPLTKIGWARERVRKKALVTIAPEIEDPQRILVRGRKYVDTFPEAISGQGGHRTTFVAALKIVRFVRQLGGTDDDAWRLLVYYNSAKCRPEWDEAALLHKWKEGLRLAK